MPIPTHIRVRGARDRLIDLLGFGETYPLQDTQVKAGRLTVPVNGTAKIPIDPSQADTRYLLRTASEESAGAVKKGTGDEILLETPKIAKDITFKVLARKIDFKDPIREDYLHQTATVKVGLDTKLLAKIDAPTLDPLNDVPAATDPRIVDYGSRVKVLVEQSQEGVDYSLVRDPRAGEGAAEIVLSEADVRGDLKTIELFIKAAAEDTEIKIRATKEFVGAEPQTDLLEVVLPLRVRANRALAASADPASIVAFGAGTAIEIAGSQKSASYRLYGRTLADRDFVYGEPGTATVLRVPVADEPDVLVLAPPLSNPRKLPAGFSALGDARPGTGGDLSLPLETLAEDSLVVVWARKEHQAGANSIIASELRLDRAVAILVRPNPAPGLALEAPVSGKSTSGPVRVTRGQPGVFYHFRQGASGQERGLPAYFHERDESESRLNKGVDQLRVEVDFAVARGATDTGSLAEARPLEPVVDLGKVRLGSSLHVRAVKARTRVAVPMSHTATLPELPEIKLEQATVAPGAQARILVVASTEGQRYQPFLNGEPVRQARNGNGEDLVFLTDALEETTTIDMVVTVAAADPIPVTLIVPLEVTVSP